MTERPNRGATRRRLASSFLLLSFAVPASAQVNIEALRRDDPPLGSSGSFSGDLTVRTGNVDFIQVGLSGRHNVVTDGVTTLLIGDGGIGLLGSSRFASSGLLHYRRTYRVLEWVWPEWYAQANYDRAQLLRFRTVVGGGARTPVARGDWGQFGAGTGVMLEHERLKLDEAAVHPRRTTTIRSSTFLTLRLSPAEQLVVTSTTYLQPRVGNPGDVRVLESFRLASPISEQLALTVSFDMRYDSDPPDGIARLDTTLRTGVTYTY